MTSKTTHGFKRVVAGICSLMIVTGSVPMQPVADVFNSIAIAVSAGTAVTYTVTYSIGNYSYVVSDSYSESDYSPNRGHIEDFL